MTTPQTETPRTDSEAQPLAEILLLALYGSVAKDYVSGDKARELEKELQQAKREVCEAVTKGKLEALQYTPEEKERYVKWVMEGAMYQALKREKAELAASEARLRDSFRKLKHSFIKASSEDGIYKEEFELCMKLFDEALSTTRFDALEPWVKFVKDAQRCPDIEAQARTLLQSIGQ